ncbi:hypothetical protein PENSPDRAFT_646478 [Peniophora sp. CONT]|nr:hypothetical protein PENSPDRAFT_646478 [Peniophora sp. CONT]
MDVDENIQTETRGDYTILRIKRKRTDEPLEALVVNSKRRKSKGGVDVFQFAETVEEAAWKDAERMRVVQERVSALARQPIKRPEQPATGTKRTDALLSPPVNVPPPKSARHYRILPQLHEQANTPPKVASSKDAEQAGAFKMYDAVLESEAPKEPATEDDPEMSKFQDLLQDYLNLHDIDPSAQSSASSSAGVPIAAPAPLPPTDDPDYVWDVFYHRAGLMDDLEELPAVNVGTLTGLPGNFDAGDSDDEESVEGDEADEDSNDEGFYRNDYPDEGDDSDYESEGSDVFHDGSSGEDVSADLDFQRGYR